MLLTHYQFVGTFLKKDVNIMNRWYLWDNNTHPTEKHKYFNQYKNFINKNIEKKYKDYLSFRTRERNLI